MKAFLSFVLLGTFVSACGASATSKSGDPSSTALGDTRSDAGDGGLSTTAPSTGEDGGDCGATTILGCEDPCGGKTFPPVCVSGAWECPLVSAIDATCVVGPAGCSAPARTCPLYCATQGSQAYCAAGEWTCLSTACLEDAGSADE